MKETDLIKELEALPRSIRPQRDLWPGISNRLGSVAQGYGQGYGSSNTTPIWRLPALAAAVLLALTTGIFIGRGMQVQPAGQMDRSALEYALAGTVAATEREYQAAFQELVPLDYSGIRLAGDNADALRGSWEDLQQAETSLLAALRQYPSNIYLNEKFLDLRSQQLQFIKQLALLEQNDWRRT